MKGKSAISAAAYDDDVHSDKYINKTKQNIPASSLIFFFFGLQGVRLVCVSTLPKKKEKLNIFLCCWRDEREETNKRQTTTGCPVCMCMGKKCLKLSWKCVPPDAWLLTAPGWPLMMKPVDPSIHPSIHRGVKKKSKKIRGRSFCIISNGSKKKKKKSYMARASALSSLTLFRSLCQ